MFQRTMILTAVLCAVVAAVSAAKTVAQPQGTEVLLPDFNIVTPQGLLARRTFESGDAKWKLGFISAVYNQGAGPAIIHGERSIREPDQMTAQQVIMRPDGSTVTLRDVGRIRYDVEPTHAHWHLQRFMTYELRRVSDYKLMRPDEKRGFCLADRFRVPKAKYPRTPRIKVYTFDCEGKNSAAATVDEGMSVGWGDDYTQLRDGQQIDITGIPAGEYYLVNRVNASRRLKESSYGNNTSSIRVRLAWPGGPRRRPTTAIVAACTNTDRCRSGTYFDPIG